MCMPSVLARNCVEAGERRVHQVQHRRDEQECELDRLGDFR